MAQAQNKFTCRVSSTIKHVAYYATTLTVTFTSGKIYAYRNVPRYVFESFRRARSKGKFFNRNIVNQFECTRVEIEPSGRVRQQNADSI